MTSDSGTEDVRNTQSTSTRSTLLMMKTVAITIRMISTIQRMYSQLAAKTLEERLAVPGLHAGRAPTIVAGVVILIQVMRAFGLHEIEVSEHDILYGAALEADERIRAAARERLESVLQDIESTRARIDALLKEPHTRP